MRERFGATNPKALALRFHAQTGGSTLTAQQPENNVVRVAIQALSAVAGGAQSLHTNCYDEALALPSEHAAHIALRTQQILAAEAGTTDTADPLGGSYYIESLTDELEARAWELIERVDEAGGAVAAVESGFVQEEIEQAAFEFQQQVEAGERVIVGVNAFEEEADERVELLHIDPAAERRQLERTARVRAERNAEEATAAIAAVRETARGDANLLPPCATRCAPGAPSARSARRCARSGGCTTRCGRASSRSWRFARVRKSCALRPGRRNSAAGRARSPGCSVLFLLVGPSIGMLLLCARARQRPARARCGLRLSRRFAAVLASAFGAFLV